MKRPIGSPAPWFTAATPSRPDYAFSSVAGRYVLLIFLPSDPNAQATAMSYVKAHRALFDDVKLVAFGVLRDAVSIAAARDEPPGLRWFFDTDGAIGRPYGAIGAEGEEVPMWVLLDPTLRVMGWARLSEAELVFRNIRALPHPDDHAGVPLHAPVLIVPRVFEPSLCRRLIDYYEQVGGQVSGVMRQVNGRTVGVVDNFKKRRDADIADEGLRTGLRQRIEHRLLPQIERAFQFKATRLERYIVACYDAEEGGYFNAHRDNTTSGTAHRQFACSINLNAEQFEGGDLRFPEYGSKTYRPPTGGAVVFSCSMLHEATPVTRGRRYAFLPFLYNEAGAAVREANLHTFIDAPEAPGPGRDTGATEAV